MRATLIATVVVTVLGCAGDLEVRRDGAANPEAPEAPLSSALGVLTAGFDPDRVAPPSPAAAGHDHHEHGAPSGATQYTCPHHPEVVSDKPGTCPKCKMDLEPKKPEPKKDDHEGHDHGVHP